MLVPAVALLGGGLAAVGAFYSVAGLSLMGGLVAAVAVFFSQFEQQKQEIKLDDANKKVEELSEKLVALTTGGNGYCYLALCRSTGRFLVVNETNFPLYDVSVRILDVRAFDERMRVGAGLIIGRLEKSQVSLVIGNVNPNQARYLTELGVPLISVGLDWNIFFHARNGFWTQLLRIRPAPDLYVHATLVEAHGAKVREVVDEGFLLPGEKEPDWR